MRQQSKLFSGATEAEVWTSFNTWLSTAEHIPVVNHWFIDLENLRIAVVYSERNVESEI